MKNKCDWLISRLNMIKGKIFELGDISIETSKNWKARQQNWKNVQSHRTTTKCNMCNGNIRRKKRMDKKVKQCQISVWHWTTDSEISDKRKQAKFPKPSDPGISFLNYIKLKKNCPERNKRGWGGKLPTEEKQC